MNKLVLLAFACPLFLTTHAFADDGVADIDVRGAEFLDVIETADGSIWKGVVVEQTPNVQYKIATADGSLHVIKAGDVLKLTKQRNRERRSTLAPMGGGAGGMGRESYDGAAGAAVYEPGSGLPAPMARTGLRVEPELVAVFPSGIYDDLGFGTSVAPGVRVGYETMFENFGLTGGAMARFTYWNLPGDTKDATWLLETQLFGRAALHIGRATPYLGMSIGLDTNYFYSNQARMSNTFTGFGMNLQTGLQIAITPTTALDIGLDYHPGTDTVSDSGDESVEYFGLHIGTAFRL